MVELVGSGGAGDVKVSRIFTFPQGFERTTCGCYFYHGAEEKPCWGSYGSLVRLIIPYFVGYFLSQQWDGG